MIIVKHFNLYILFRQKLKQKNLKLLFLIIQIFIHLYLVKSYFLFFLFAQYEDYVKK